MGETNAYASTSARFVCARTNYGLGIGLIARIAKRQSVLRCPFLNTHVVCGSLRDDCRVFSLYTQWVYDWRDPEFAKGLDISQPPHRNE